MTGKGAGNPYYYWSIIIVFSTVIFFIFNYLNYSIFFKNIRPYADEKNTPSLIRHFYYADR